MTGTTHNQTRDYHDEARAKLVRDRIPDLIKAEGRQARIHVATDAEFHKLLRTKLTEEVQEFLTSGELEELADILEVVHALGAELGAKPSDLEAVRAAKAADRGAFERRIVLHA